MTALDLAKANVAASAFERCLRLQRAGGYCSRLSFRRAPRVRAYGLPGFVSGLPFILMLILAAVAMAHR